MRAFAVRRIPRVYRRVPGGPGPGPVYWMREESGVLAAAVRAFLDWRIDRWQTPAPDSEQLALLVEYCDHWIFCPLWEQNPEIESFRPELERLRQSVGAIETAEQLSAWLRAALEHGIDPL